MYALHVTLRELVLQTLFNTHEKDFLHSLLRAVRRQCWPDSGHLAPPPCATAYSTGTNLYSVLSGRRFPPYAPRKTSDRTR